MNTDISLSICESNGSCLPREIWEEVWSFLPAADALKIPQISKLWKEIFEKCLYLQLIKVAAFQCIWPSAKLVVHIQSTLDKANAYAEIALAASRFSTNLASEVLDQAEKVGISIRDRDVKRNFFLEIAKKMRTEISELRMRQLLEYARAKPTEKEKQENQDYYFRNEALAEALLMEYKQAKENCRLLKNKEEKIKTLLQIANYQIENQSKDAVNTLTEVKEISNLVSSKKSRIKLCIKICSSEARIDMQMAKTSFLEACKLVEEIRNKNLFYLKLIKLSMQFPELENGSLEENRIINMAIAHSEAMKDAELLLDISFLQLKSSVQQAKALLEQAKKYLNEIQFTYSKFKVYLKIAKIEKFLGDDTAEEMLKRAESHFSASDPLVKSIKLYKTQALFSLDETIRKIEAVRSGFKTTQVFLDNFRLNFLQLEIDLKFQQSLKLLNGNSIEAIFMEINPSFKIQDIKKLKEIYSIEDPYHACIDKLFLRFITQACQNFKRLLPSLIGRIKNTNLTNVEIR